MRQNLALVLGIQGKYDEAIQVAQAELDPQQAKANIAYLQAMMQKPPGLTTIFLTSKTRQAGDDLTRLTRFERTI
ncbi:hypothetical protein QW131_28105 [Roseibium salinum]|nr:hypothetical protein [Roseibium salinum]